MTSQTLVKCEHPPCSCLVEAEQKFCSAVCASARGSARGPCMCGHEGCAEGQQLAEGEDAPSFSE
jgi:hypothetical protein